MEPYAIKQAAFITSVGADRNYPPALPCEIAMVGRSNVGKSSLINALTGRSKLARTSGTPGLTRLINYFKLNDQLYLVDLPGYGYAKAAKAERTKWGELMNAYLGSGRVSHLILLMDIRHGPSGEDRQMYEWLLYYGIPFTLVATKADKLSKSQRKVMANKAAKDLGAPPYAIPFSAETREGKDELLIRIAGVYADCAAIAARQAEKAEADGSDWAEA